MGGWTVNIPASEESAFCLRGQRRIFRSHECDPSLDAQAPQQPALLPHSDMVYRYSRFSDGEIEVWSSSIPRPAPRILTVYGRRSLWG